MGEGWGGEGDGGNDIKAISSMELEQARYMSSHCTYFGGRGISSKIYYAILYMHTIVE